ncbi:hypothetical protein [Pararhodobacter sp.]|uniref:hypothetical protein n=1 Tax=Pararhodobacter sp. TaxID=2127056 RepID=UPI002FDC7DAC
MPSAKICMEPSGIDARLPHRGQGEWFPESSALTPIGRASPQKKINPQYSHTAGSRNTDMIAFRRGSSRFHLRSDSSTARGMISVNSDCGAASWVYRKSLKSLTSKNRAKRPNLLIFNENDLTVNQLVVGSIPTAGAKNTKKIKMIREARESGLRRFLDRVTGFVTSLRSMYF